jgi:prepilin-type N-terminal cleavage/methylation domain-containing protein
MNCPMHECPLNRDRGFTLIELVLVMTLLIMVLSVSYGLIVDCLEADRTIERLTAPEKVGEGVLALMREDLSGTIWRHLGTRVFFIHDNGRGDNARDELRFLSTVEPTPNEAAMDGSAVEVLQLRTITGVNYFLRQNDNRDGVETYTLFRKEIVDLYGESPLEGSGVSYEIYNKMAFLSIECYDGWGVDPIYEWDSERQIEWEETERAARQDNEGIGRVSGARNAPDTTLTAPGRPLEDSALLDVPPPAAIPRAVHVEIGFYTGTGDRIERDIRGDPILKTFSTIVPILTSQRIPLPQQDDFGPGSDGLDSDLGDEDGSAGLSGTAGARTSDPRSGGAGQGSRSPRGRRRKPEATSR